MPIGSRSTFRLTVVLTFLLHGHVHIDVRSSPYMSQHLCLSPAYTYTHPCDPWMTCTHPCGPWMRHCRGTHNVVFGRTCLSNYMHFAEEALRVFNKWDLHYYPGIYWIIEISPLFFDDMMMIIIVCMWSHVSSPKRRCVSRRRSWTLSCLPLYD